LADLSAGRLAAFLSNGAIMYGGYKVINVESVATDELTRIGEQIRVELESRGRRKRLAEDARRQGEIRRLAGVRAGFNV
jgi:hypothetical protein